QRQRIQLSQEEQLSSQDLYLEARLRSDAQLQMPIFVYIGELREGWDYLSPRSRVQVTARYPRFAQTFCTHRTILCSSNQFPAMPPLLIETDQRSFCPSVMFGKSVILS